MHSVNLAVTAWRRSDRKSCEVRRATLFIDRTLRTMGLRASPDDIIAQAAPVDLFCVYNNARDVNGTCYDAIVNCQDVRVDLVNGVVSRLRQKKHSLCEFMRLATVVKRSVQSSEREGYCHLLKLDYDSWAHIAAYLDVTRDIKFDDHNLFLHLRANARQYLLNWTSH